ncbi:MAG: ABC transporter ATP-binding protein [Clostridia bacterium]|nr:ABC transporter ATP-binding protein [Clostridia bacterium]
MLEINNLVKTYGTKKAVNNLTIQVPSGEICAFIGHNGAGKTTALKAISGIIDFEGEIMVDGKSIKTQPLEVKKIIGYLPDNPDLYENLKGIDYLNFIADVYEINAETRQKRIEEYAKRLKIYDDLKAVISTYSHGMKQKLALVSIFIHKPKLYLFDEPFVGLDPISSHELKKIMDEECKNGCTFFYSTHILEVAEKICSSIVIIKKGKLMGSGKMKDVKGDKDLEKLFLELEKNDD